VRMQLSLDTLKDFDVGKAAVAFQHALKRVVTDCLERPGTKATRKVVLTANVAPLMQQDGDVVDAEVDFTIQAKTPPWQTATKPLAITRGGQLMFNDLAPDNPHQKTIDDAIDDE